MFESKKQQSFKKQLPKNLSTNMISFLVSILIGILLVPYYIDTLGVASYALVPLATSITSYINLVTQSLNSSVSRYLTVDIQREDINKANITFNTSLFGMFGISLLSIPIVIAISYYTPSFFEVPIDQKYDAYLLFLGVMFSFLISTFGGVFGVSLFAYNRLDLQNILSIFDALIRVGVIVLLFSRYTPRLSYIGFANLIASTIIFIITVYLSRKVNPHFKVNISDFRASEMKEMIKTGNWLIINQIGSLLFLQMDLIIVNKLFGSIAGGEYAALLTLSRLLRSMGGILAGVLTPIVLTYYAKSQFEKMIDISKSAVKFMGFFMALPIGCLCGFAPNILSIWLGPEFVKLSPLLWILLCHHIINLAVLPLFPINVAFNKVRIPGLITLFMGIGNFVLAIILSYFTDWGYYGVAVAGAIMLTLKNSFFIPFYATKIMEIPRSTFLNSMLPGVISMLMIAGIITMIKQSVSFSTLFSIVSFCMVVSLIYALMIWILGLNVYEHKVITSFVPFKWRNKI